MLKRSGIAEPIIECLQIAFGEGDHAFRAVPPYALSVEIPTHLLAHRLGYRVLPISWQACEEHRLHHRPMRLYLPALIHPAPIETLLGEACEFQAFGVLVGPSTWSILQGRLAMARWWAKSVIMVASVSN